MNDYNVAAAYMQYEQVHYGEQTLDSIIFVKTWMDGANNFSEEVEVANCMNAKEQSRVLDNGIAIIDG